jgi:hypothetical protein
MSDDKHLTEDIKAFLAQQALNLPTAKETIDFFLEHPEEIETAAEEFIASESRQIETFHHLNACMICMQDVLAYMQVLLNLLGDANRNPEEILQNLCARVLARQQLAKREHH